MSYETSQEPLPSEAGGDSISGGAPSSGPTPRVFKKPRPQVALPTDRLKFDGQKAALKAVVVASDYGRRGVTAEDLAPHMGVAPTTAGLNNAFFMEAGLVVRESKGRYKPTDAACAYVRKLGFNETQAAALLGEPMRSSRYYQELQSLLQTGPANHNQAIEILAHVVGATKEHGAQLASVLSWLEYAGLIVETNGFVQLGQRDLQELHAPSGPQNDGGGGSGSGVGVGTGQGHAPADGSAPTGSTGLAGPSRIVRPGGGTASQGTTKDLAPERRTVLSLRFEFDLAAEDLGGLSPEQIAALFEAVGKVAAIKAALG